MLTCGRGHGGVELGKPLRAAHVLQPREDPRVPLQQPPPDRLPHLDILAEVVEKVVDGEAERLLVGAGHRLQALKHEAPRAQFNRK